MSQQEFEPDANAFDPGFTEPGFSTPGHETWASPEHPGNADRPAPGGGARRRNLASRKS